MFLHVWLQVLPKLACSWSEGRAAGREKGSTCLLQAPHSTSALLQVFLKHISTFCVPAWPLHKGSTVEEPTPNVVLQLWGGAGSSSASCHPWVRLLARDLWFGLTKYAPLVKIAPNRWIGRWGSYSIKLIHKLMNTAMNLVLVWVHGSALERALGWAVFHPRMRFLYR